MLPPRFKEQHYKARFSPRAIFFSRVVSLDCVLAVQQQMYHPPVSFDINDPDCYEETGQSAIDRAAMRLK
jgi:hypothetical protein